MLDCGNNTPSAVADYFQLLLRSAGRVRRMFHNTLCLFSFHHSVGFTSRSGARVLLLPFYCCFRYVNAGALLQLALFRPILLGALPEVDLVKTLVYYNL